MLWIKKKLLMSSQGKYSNSKIIRYPNKYKNVPTCEVIFINKESINDSHLKFTNFLERGLTSPRNKLIKNIICNLIEHPEEFDNIVESRDVSIQTRADLQKVKRVEKILKLNLKTPDPNQIIFKGTLLDSDERGFQLLFTMNNDKKYIYLIDLYHLTIPSGTNRKKQAFELFFEYEKRKKYKKDIQNILF